MRACRRDLGTMDYRSCWELQQTLFDELAARKRGAKNTSDVSAAIGSSNAERSFGTADADPDSVGTVLLVEHPPVYTLGKSGRAENLLVGRAALERLGAEFFHIDRGGDITFHGPGQRVCYPILDLERIGIGLRDYIDRLEEAVIRTVAAYGIAAGRIPGASGVWVEGADTTPASTEKSGSAASEPMSAERGCVPRKICAIGVRSSRFVTMHGLALNVSTDLEWFSRINPCGFVDRGVTSIERECGCKIAMNDVDDALVANLSKILNVDITHR